MIVLCHCVNYANKVLIKRQKSRFVLRFHWWLLTILLRLLIFHRRWRNRFVCFVLLHRLVLVCFIKPAALLLFESWQELVVNWGQLRQNIGWTGRCLLMYTALKFLISWALFSQIFLMSSLSYVLRKIYRWCIVQINFWCLFDFRAIIVWFNFIWYLLQRGCVIFTSFSLGSKKLQVNVDFGRLIFLFMLLGQMLLVRLSRAGGNLCEVSRMTLSYNLRNILTVGGYLLLVAWLP